MATTSFFYGGSTAPDQNTTDELIDALNEKVAAADADRVAAQQAASAASASAISSSVSAGDAAASAAQAAALISHFTISTSDPTGGVDGDVWFKINT